MQSHTDTSLRLRRARHSRQLLSMLDRAHTRHPDMMIKAVVPSSAYTGARGNRCRHRSRRRGRVA